MIMPDPVTLMTGLAGVGSAIANPFLQMEQNRWNARQMRLQNQWNLEQWQRENAYNTPLAQMARLQAAGINPALAYSNGAPMNEAATSPEMMASQGEAPQISSSLFSSLAGLAQNQQLVESQANLNNIKAGVMKDKLPKELQILDSTIELIGSNTALNNQMVEQSKAYTKVLGEEFQQKFIENEYLAQTLNDRVKIVKAERIIKATEASYIRDNIVAQLNNLRESTRLMRSSRFLNAQMGAHYAAVDRNLSYANQQMEAMAEYIRKKGDNIPVENITGFVNAGANALQAGARVIESVLSAKGSAPGPMNPYGVDYNVSR